EDRRMRAPRPVRGASNPVAASAAGLPAAGANGPSGQSAATGASGPTGPSSVTGASGQASRTGKTAPRRATRNGKSGPRPASRNGLPADAGEAPPTASL